MLFLHLWDAISLSVLHSPREGDWSVQASTERAGALESFQGYAYDHMRRRSQCLLCSRRSSLPGLHSSPRPPISSEDTDINTRAPFSELLDFTSPLLSPRNSDFKSYGQVTFQETGPFSIFISGFRVPVRAQGNTVHWHKTCFFFVFSSISEVEVFKKL